jgi:DNA-directed RNA polymerase specialized sigma24 family protein
MIGGAVGELTLTLETLVLLHHLEQLQLEDFALRCAQHTSNVQSELHCACIHA